MVQTKSTNNTLVCDIGSGAIKVGFAGKLSPGTVVPCVTGIARIYHWKINKDKERKILIGDDAIAANKKQKVGYEYPIDASGEVRNWKHVELILQEAFQRLNIIDCSNLKILVTKPNNMKRDDIKALLDLFFFTFGFRAVTMHEQAALVLYTQGVESGVVVEMGESMVHIVPVYKGHAIPKTDKSLAVGGRSITHQLLKLLRLKGYQLNDKEDTEVVRQMKEKYCYVSTELETDERLADETTVHVESYQLPDGTSISIGRERFEATEAFFKPAMLNVESSGISDMIFNVIQDADIDCRADLYQNIILSGGSSLMCGMRTRIETEMNDRYNRDVLHGDQSRSQGWTPRVLAPENRQHLVFEGATLFADLISNEESFWVTSNDYKQGGIQSVLGKCNIY
jgi:actin-related protein 2